MYGIVALNHTEFVVEDLELGARRLQRSRIERPQTKIFPDKIRVGSLPRLESDVAVKILFESHLFLLASVTVVFLIPIYYTTKPHRNQQQRNFFTNYSRRRFKRLFPLPLYSLAFPCFVSFSSSFAAAERG